ncbi:MAG: Fic family protein [Gammaproteobacteria bacterium]|nr:Fic family protein [Gammaproteobacteria bacterium]
MPTVLAVSTESDRVIAGEEARIADDTSFLKLGNWKMLLGKSNAELQTEMATNSDLANILRRANLFELAKGYFEAMLKQTLGSEPEILENPQTIIGIPPAASEDQVKWRKNYKRQIERIFHELGYPKPKFWPEPFAVFQYHLNRVEIRDVGTRQNVLIIDIGGGTTNVCLVQTTLHGRLARGGVNHVPHGVRSAEVGGATLDACIAAELGLDGSISHVANEIKSAKEALSATQAEWSGNNLSNTVEFESDGQSIELSAGVIKSVFVAKVWPAVDATLDECLEEIGGKEIQVDRVHIVILAGGTCQLGLVQELVKEKLARHSRFAEAKYLVSSDYRNAVAHGLAIEAAANSRHHEMMPSRVSAYLQEDLKFECGHKNDDLYKPPKLRGSYASQGDLSNGILLKAPKQIGVMLHKPRTWDFQLKQNTREFFYRFSKCTDDEETEVLLDNWKRIARTSDERPGRKMDLTMTLQDDGFAKLSVVTSGDLTCELDPIDLHDLSELQGDTFFALDFGTDNTQVAYVNIKDPDLLEPLPTSYAWDPRAEKRARDLVTRVESVLGPSIERARKIKALNDRQITDYVYHSNRIEGSLLDRGDTQRVLDGSHDTIREPPAAIVGTIEGIGIIDERGEIKSAPMVIKDTLAAVNLRDAFQFVEDLSHDGQPFSAVVLRQIHGLVMKGVTSASPGEFRKENVTISQTTFVPPDFVQVDHLSGDMVERMSSVEFTRLPPLIQAVEIHARFVSIHPFADGNGRVARLLANYLMWQHDLPGILLPWENRDRYYDALEECNSKEPGQWGNLNDLINLFCDVLDEAVEQLADYEVEGDEVSVDSTVVDAHEDDSEFGRLITELKGSGRTTRLNF